MPHVEYGVFARPFALRHQPLVATSEPRPQCARGCIRPSLIRRTNATPGNFSTYGVETGNRYSIGRIVNQQVNTSVSFL